MAKVVLFPRPSRPFTRQHDSQATVSSPFRQVMDWCLMLLQQTEASELDIPLPEKYPDNTIFAVITEFRNRGWIVTTDGPRTLKFKRA